MKRNTKSAPDPPTKLKKLRTNNHNHNTSKPESGEDMSPEKPASASGGPPNIPPPAEPPDISDITMYSCETTNRFAILPIQSNHSPVLRPPKKVNQHPPKIFIADIRPNVQKQLSQFKGFILENVRDGTNVLPSDLKQHKNIIEMLDAKRIQYFTHALPGEKLKRFVVYGLGSADYDQVSDDLSKYGITAVKVVQKIPQKQRYHDHCNYVVYVKTSDNINLEMIKQARYLCNTSVTWANFIVNGDGCGKCYRCQRFNHSGDNCNMNPRCAVCSGHHLTVNCELLAEKRAQNKSKIDPVLLNCVHCNGKHTAGYTKCTERIKFIDYRQRRTQRWTEAPVPTINPWTDRRPIPPQLPARALNNQQVNPTAPIVPLNFINNSFTQQQQPPMIPNNNIPNPDKFTAQEIAAIFNHILDCVDGCQTKKDQLRVLTNVVAQYYI